MNACLPIFAAMMQKYSNPLHDAAHYLAVIVANAVKMLPKRKLIQ